MAKRKREVLFSKDALDRSWAAFRWDFERARSAGVDGVRYADYKATSRVRIKQLSSVILDGSYQHSKLRVQFIDKGNGKVRCINIPTIDDRLVQRVILSHIVESYPKKLGKHPAYGVLKGQSTLNALSVAETLLPASKFVVCVDVHKFFDTIARDKVEALVRRTVTARSIQDIAVAPVNAETRIEGPDEKYQFHAAGMRHTVGLRQGQPLSPLYAYLFLEPLDSMLRRRGLKFIRYVDDVLVFCQSSDEAKRVRDFISETLATIDLELSPTKTLIQPANDRLEFLGVGLQCKPDGTVDRYVPKGLQKSIEDRMDLRLKSMLQETKAGSFVRFLNYTRSVGTSYRSTYRTCRDWPKLEAAIVERSRYLLRSSVGIVHKKLNSNLKLEQYKAAHMLGVLPTENEFQNS